MGLHIGGGIQPSPQKQARKNEGGTMPELPRNYPKKKYRVHRKDRQGKHHRQYNTGSTVWRRIREKQLTMQPLCVECSTDDVLVPANTVDHIDGNAWNNSMDNLQSMCVACHSRKTVREDGGFGYPR